MTLFTNVVEGEFCELRVDGALRCSYVACSSSSGPKSCVCFTAHVCYVYTKPSCWIEAEKLAPILGCLGRVEPVAQPATTANGGGRFFVLQIGGGAYRGRTRGGATALPGQRARGHGPACHRHRP